MSMNRWDCAEPGCKSVAIGVGGAIGLRAVGWYFKRGSWEGRALIEPITRCPAHRPDPVRLCRVDENGGMPCGVCSGEEEAHRWQEMIERRVAEAAR